MAQVEGGAAVADGGSVALQCGTNPSRVVIAAVHMYNNGGAQETCTTYPKINSVTMTLLNAPWNGALFGLAIASIGSLTAVGGIATGGTTPRAVTCFIAYSGILQTSYNSTPVVVSQMVSPSTLADPNCTIGDMLFASWGKANSSVNGIGYITARAAWQTNRAYGANTNNTKPELWADSGVATATTMTASWTNGGAGGGLIVVSLHVAPAGGEAVSVTPYSMLNKLWQGWKAERTWKRRQSGILVPDTHMTLAF